ncbi:MAG: energy-coupling factor transporter ATPase [Anaerolineae bacterium]|nr:energy-coupling factor transporter ATPase [Anaerolineae bacterium]
MISNDYPLEIEDLSFKYRSRTELALKHVSLKVAKGEILLIAGASGCGKTTLARCINGLIPRSYKGEITGKIKLHGKEVVDLPLARVSQLVGTVLQDPERQILGTKVLNEVAFGLENLGKSREEIYSTVDEALGRLGISHLRDRETFNLSGGEKQKVALAGVLAMHPALLLLDEPLASLDPASAQDTLSIVRRLANEGMTVLMVEHRVEDVLAINPDRILFMQEGEIRYLGGLEGLEKVVDYHEVKLPARMIMHMAAKDPAPQEVSPLPVVEAGAPPHKLVRFCNVSFGYEQENEVLHGINLDINEGDVIAVLGPNGTGKTTLVKHAIGLLKPRKGQVLVEGKNTHDISVAQIASTLGYVFQSPSHMLFAPTIKDELAFGPSNLKHAPETIEKEVGQALEIVHMSGMEKIAPLSISFGQQKRISIAAVLAMQSKILVMDEPTAGQDYKNYISFMESILQLPSFKAILFITHDVDLAAIYANRVLLVKGGQVVADGTPVEVLSDFDRLRDCRVMPTTLLQANLDLLPKTGRFMRAEALAHVTPLN